jgi:hypothetical protein
MKLQKKIPAWHELVISELKKDFSEINALEATAAKRRAYLGLKLIYVKEKGRSDESIPHGQWNAFFETHFKGIPLRTAQRYMAEGESLAEKMGWQIRQIGVFKIPPHKLLEMPAIDLTAKNQKAQQLLLDLIEERGKFSRRTEYVQTDDDGRRHVGRIKGEGGATKEQRLAAQERAEQQTKEELEEELERIAGWLLENGDALHLGLCDLKPLWKLREACQYVAGFITRLESGRKGPQ